MGTFPAVDVLSEEGRGGVSESDLVEVILAGLVVVVRFVVRESDVDVLLDVWGMEAGMKGWISYDVVGDCSLDEGFVVIKEITLLIVWVANEDCWYGFGAELVICVEYLSEIELLIDVVWRVER
nr:hypothetical protein [Tanacetum cinerariifolium]